MRAGDIVSGRFLIQSLVGAGGMGTVYRALDQQTGQPAAVKVMSDAGGLDESRFLREARVLAGIDHPNVVRYLAHGPVDNTGGLFLAMEWLDGEDLAARLVRKGLGADEVIELARVVAEGLAALHDAGIIHRDIKPANLFLVDGDAKRTRIVDFGVARWSAHTDGNTQTGVVLGTVGYLAPEQITATRSITPATDIFGLGCVLFECLTGRVPFVGDTSLAVMIAVLHDDAPSPRSLRAEVPPQLDKLVVRMLSKRAEERPSSGRALLEALANVNTPPTTSPSLQPPDMLTQGEQRVVSVLLSDRFPTEEGAKTLREGELESRVAPLRTAAEQHGGTLVPLADGGLMVSMSGTDSRDQARRAARCALALRPLLPSASLALATGRAETTMRGPMGPVIERALTLLRLPAAEDGVRVDALTSDLLGRRFLLQQDDYGHVLLSQSFRSVPPGAASAAPGPQCHGRNKELAYLHAALAEAGRECAARAIVLSGPPGCGKSRVAEELALMPREMVPRSEVMVSADVLAMASPYGVARQMVATGSGFATLDTDVASALAAPASSIDSDPFAAKRLREAALTGWLAEECAKGFTVITVEDAHWIDAPTLAWLMSAVEQLAHQPLAVVLLARPELNDRFPGLRADNHWQELKLLPLTAGAVRRYIQQTHPLATKDFIERVIHLADGHAQYVEEVVRHAIEGGADELPESLLAIVEARLLRLDSQARRVLRAASVHGGHFTAEAIAPMLGFGDEAALVTPWLETLVANRLLVHREEMTAELHGVESAADTLPQPSSSRVYGFRQHVIQAAAYAMLTEADRRRGHRIAGEWLAAHEAYDGLRVAEHFERSDEPALAVPWLVAAGHTAFESGDLKGAVALVDRARACASEEQPMTAVALILAAAAHGWLANWSDSASCAREAMTHTEPGTAAWYRATSSLAFAATATGDPDAAEEVFAEINNLPTEAHADPFFGRATATVIASLILFGRAGEALSLQRRLESVQPTKEQMTGSFELWRLLSRSYVTLLVNNDLAHGAEAAETMLHEADRVQDALGRAFAYMIAGRVYLELGRFDEADQLLASAVEQAKARGIHYLEGWARMMRSGSLHHLGHLEQAIELAQGVALEDDGILGHLARGLLVQTLVTQGQLDEAANEYERHPAPMEMPLVCVIQHAGLGSIALRRGEPQKALMHADTAIEIAKKGVAKLYEQTLADVIRGRALWSLGRESDAKNSLRAARDRIEAIAVALDAKGIQHRIRDAHRLHVEVYSLAAKWGIDE